jgi:antibiotic biosynthesis monooxygenase (ABM) superfamily enzyme
VFALSPHHQKEHIMTAFTAVRFKVKAGREQQFLDAHNKIATAWPGLTHANIIKTGERTFCIIAEWIDVDAIANARASMIATLDSFRDTLEDLGGGSAPLTRSPARW